MYDKSECYELIFFYAVKVTLQEAATERWN